MIEFEENVNGDTLVGMLKRAAINAVDNHARLISGINILVIKRNDQRDDLCELVGIERKHFLKTLFVVAVNETLALIRRQYEELEREKQNLLLEQSSHEQTLRSELEKITAEKEYG